MDEFSKAYAGLNDEQKKAVDLVEGAVLVIAGPGTGKTQLLSLRVANILKQSDALPENILCLTFTNKAASNMQVRLSKLVGSSAQKVMIKTFHSFAAEVMNLYPEYFWNGATLTNVPDAVQLEIITDILSSLPLDNPLALKFAGQFTGTRDVQDALKLSKEAGLTPDKLRALIHINIDYITMVEPLLVDICSERLSYKKLDEFAMRIEGLPEQNIDEFMRPLQALSTVLLSSFETAHSADNETDKTKYSSAWKTRWIQTVNGVKGMHKERKSNDWWLRLADVYEAYRNTLHERGFYDYSDMIIEVITQLEQNADMRADIQEKFQYVLIDEFQDTNSAQLRLAHLVADHYAQEGNPNIMVVGDDDQSIYKFNGAELSNMRDFKRSYKQAREFILTDNYRSSQAVLDFSMKIIEQASERIISKDSTVTKQLVAKNSPAHPGEIMHISYPTKEHEYYSIAQKISEMRQQPGSIAVLARGHESLRKLAHALHIAGVPVRYEQQQSITEQPLVVQILHVCEIITALSEGDESKVNKYLALLLAHDVWHIKPIVLWELALQNRREPHWIQSLLDSSDSNLQNIAHWLLWLSRESQSEPLPRILEYIIGLSASEHLTSPLRRHFLEADVVDSPYLANISAVRKLIGLAQDFCEQGEASLTDFMRLMHVNYENDRIITDVSLFVTAPGAVELLTIHKAKGLEFDTVFVVDAMESIWKPSTNGRKPPANLPLRPAGDTYDDYIRLMFVAITRAKQNIYINTFATNEAGDEAIPSAIIRDILPAIIVDYKYAANPIDVLESAVSWPRLDGSDEHELLRGILEDYALSPSAFLDFLDIVKGGPNYFLVKHILRLPEAQSSAAAFGSAVHKALEIAQQQILEDRFELETILSAYETALAKQLLGDTEFNRYLPHGQQVITRLFNTYEMPLRSSGRPEMSLTVHVAGTPLRGKLDRIDYDQKSNLVMISDYKTGKPLQSLHTKNKQQEIKAWRHRTQLQLYALMVRASGLYVSKPTISSQMIYVEAESLKELNRAYTPEPAELERLEKLVSIVYAKITSLNLPDTRHYDESYTGIINFEDDLLNGSI